MKRKTVLDDPVKFMERAYPEPDQIVGAYFKEVGWLKIGLAAYGVTHLRGLTEDSWGLYVAHYKVHEAKTGKLSKKVKPAIEENCLFESRIGLGKHLAEVKARYARMVKK